MLAFNTYEAINMNNVMCVYYYVIRIIDYFCYHKLSSRMLFDQRVIYITNTILNLELIFMDAQVSTFFICDFEDIQVKELSGVTDRKKGDWYVKEDYTRNSKENSNKQHIVLCAVEHVECIFFCSSF